MTRLSVHSTATVAAIALLYAVPSAHAGLVSSSLDESVVGITLSFGPGSELLPLAGNMTGVVSGEAAAGTTPATAVLTELTPSAGPGPILTVGPPAVGGSVAYATVTNTHSNVFGSATATTMAQIRGTPSGPGGGVVNMVSVVAVTPTSATASGAAIAIATAQARDPLALAPLSVPTSALLTVDLNVDPMQPLELDASMAPSGSALSMYDLNVSSDIPGLSSLFDLDLTDNADGSGVGIAFSSPLIGDPLSEADFIPLGGGDFELGQAFEQFTVPFTIPAGILATDPTLGPVGFELDTNSFSESIASVPEPSGLALLGTGLGALALCVRRRMRPGC